MPAAAGRPVKTSGVRSRRVRGPAARRRLGRRTPTRRRAAGWAPPPPGSSGRWPSTWGSSGWCSRATWCPVVAGSTCVPGRSGPRRPSTTPSRSPRSARTRRTRIGGSGFGVKAPVPVPRDGVVHLRRRRPGDRGPAEDRDPRALGLPAVPGHPVCVARAAGAVVRLSEDRQSGRARLAVRRRLRRQPAGPGPRRPPPCVWALGGCDLGRSFAGACRPDRARGDHAGADHQDSGHAWRSAPVVGSWWCAGPALHLVGYSAPAKGSGPTWCHLAPPAGC